MFKSYKTFLIFLLIASLNVGEYICDVSISVSWIHRGNALLNNTVLTFNKDDTLNLACAATAYGQDVIFSVTKGNAPPTNINVTATSNSYDLSYTNAQTIIYDDLFGIYDGFENIIILSKGYLGEAYSSNYKIYINIGVLRPADAGTYFCMAGLPIITDGVPAGIAIFADSGGVTIQVNTKPGQAHSTRADGRNVLTYSAVLLSAAFKLLL